VYSVTRAVRHLFSRKCAEHTADIERRRRIAGLGLRRGREPSSLLEALTLPKATPARACFAYTVVCLSDICQEETKWDVKRILSLTISRYLDILDP
jgi:hypothetical protein